MEDLVGRTVAQDLLEGSVLGQVLADQSVGVLVGTALPGDVGIGEVDVGLELVRQHLMTRELLAVVQGQTGDLVEDWPQAAVRGLARGLGTAGPEFGQASVAGAPGLDAGGVVVDAHANGQSAASLAPPGVALAVRFPAAQCLEQAPPAIRSAFTKR